MKISSKFECKNVLFSVEVFPPKKENPVESIYAAAEKICTLSPDYVSVTYGAGGSAFQQKVTADLAAHLKKHGAEPLAHLTCVNSSLPEIRSMLRLLKENGVENILALRGDRAPEAGGDPELPHASDLIRFIRETGGGFDIAATCYPEGHPECDSLEEDIVYLREKVDRGATHLISQLFFDNGDFYRMLELCDKAGIHVPIQAGIMPVINSRQIQRMVSLCGAKLPTKFSKIMARYEGNPAALFDAGICYATEQIIDLISSGVRGIHLYSMNNFKVAETIHRNIKNILLGVNES